MKISKFKKILLPTLLTLFSTMGFSQSMLYNQKSYTVYLYVDKLPSFPTGNEGLIRYMNKHLKWPQIDSDVQGTVLLSFVVTKGGNIEHINVEKSLVREFDDQVIKMLQSMPKWNPGIIKGKKVDVKLYMPVDFFLNNIFVF
jgi:protein TonB